MKTVILLLMSGVALADDYTYRTYATTDSERIAMKAAYATFLKSQAATNAAWDRFDKLRENASRRAHELGVWCMIPTDDFRLLVLARGCGDNR